MVNFTKKRSNIMTHLTKHIITKSGKSIRVFDNLFDGRVRTESFMFIQQSYFRLGWADSPIPERAQHAFLYSAYSAEDCELFPYVKALANTEVAPLYEGLSIQKVAVNLSTPADTNFIHQHPEKLVVLYYANLEWKEGWHGETLFFSEDYSEIEFASPYTPGRVVVFDASIPHSIRPQSHTAAHYRFTVAITFD